MQNTHVESKQRDCGGKGWVLLCAEHGAWSYGWRLERLEDALSRAGTAGGCRRRRWPSTGQEMYGFKAASSLHWVSPGNSVLLCGFKRILLSNILIDQALSACAPDYWIQISSKHRGRGFLPPGAWRGPYLYASAETHTSKFWCPFADGQNSCLLDSVSLQAICDYVKGKLWGSLTLKPILRELLKD